jgi:hypothetical protein
MSEDSQQSYFEQYEARREDERRRERRQRLSESSGYSSIVAQGDGTFKWVTTPVDPCVTNTGSGASASITVPSQWYNEFASRSSASSWVNVSQYLNNINPVQDKSPQYPQYRLRKTYTFIGDVKVLQDCHIERKDYPESELWHVQEDVFNEYSI